MSFPEYVPTSITNITLPDYGSVINIDQTGKENRRYILEDGRTFKITISYDYLNKLQILEFVNLDFFSSLISVLEDIPLISE